MTYVFDTSSLRVLRNFYPQRFPSFWELFEAQVVSGEVISVREVRRELDIQLEQCHLREWVEGHPELFPQPNADEMRFAAEILAIPRFRALVGRKAVLMGTPVADPFVVAGARRRSGSVVTEESRRDNAVKIPNICDHFNVDCINLEAFLQQHGWRF